MQAEHHEIAAEFPEFRQRTKDLSIAELDFAASISECGRKKSEWLHKRPYKLDKINYFFRYWIIF